MALLKKDAIAHKAAVDEYFNYWDTNEVCHDISARKASYAAVAERYYDLVNDIYEHVWGKSFHFSCILPGEPISMATIRHEHYLAHKLELQEGQTVLDAGCGVGGPARQIAKLTNANIVGLNNNEYQVQRAIQYTMAEGLFNKVTFTKGDFMQVRLKPGSFDAAYSIEGTSYAPALYGAYVEMFRMLKPGGAFAVYELILTNTYNDNDLEHREIRYSIEKGLGLTNIAKISEAIEALTSAGFDVEEAEDLACRHDEIPWYYPISGSLMYINSVWDTPRMVHMAFLRSRAAQILAGVCEAVRILPPGSHKITDNLERLSDALVRAGERKLFTPLFFMLGRKPR